MEGRKSEYKYKECGLNSVTLTNILVFHCTSCNAVVPEIPVAGILHRHIALGLLTKETLLSGEEVRFLRKLCGYSIAEFVQIMGSSKQVVSRWENRNTTHGKEVDRLIRLLTVAKLIGELAETPESTLKNVTAQELTKRIEKRFKTLVDSRTESAIMTINPDTLSKFGGWDFPDQSSGPSVQ